MSRRLYRRFTMGAVEWRIYRATADDVELKPLGSDQESCMGATAASECAIILNEEIPAREVPPTTIHEMLHAAFEASGLGHTMGFNLKKEERIVHALAPFLAQALVTGGFWKNPRGEE